MNPLPNSWFERITLGYLWTIEREREVDLGDGVRVFRSKRGRHWIAFRSYQRRLFGQADIPEAVTWVEDLISRHTLRVVARRKKGGEE